MEVDQSWEVDFCLALARSGAILAFRGGAPALCLRQSLLTLQARRLPLAGWLFFFFFFSSSFSVEPGLFLGALGEGPRQKGRWDIKAAGDRMTARAEGCQQTSRLIWGW